MLYGQKYSPAQLQQMALATLQSDSLRRTIVQRVKIGAPQRRVA